jgi:hypothetical protein
MKDPMLDELFGEDEKSDQADDNHGDISHRDGYRDMRGT